MKGGRPDMLVHPPLGVTAWRFLATMQLRIPLRVLELQDHVHRGPDPPQFTKSMHEGIWLPYIEGPLAFLNHVGSEMSSDIGPIPRDGGLYLVFLKVVRGIAESAASVVEPRSALLEELEKTDWRFFVDKHDGCLSICARFFPSFLTTVPRLTRIARNAMWVAGLRAPESIVAAPDEQLLSISGIGPVVLAGLRAACQAPSDPTCEYVDNVAR